MIDRWIAEATECDFKVALEVKKPKSWLKSVSAFANGIGGTLFFGIDDDRNVIGLTSKSSRERSSVDSASASSTSMVRIPFFFAVFSPSNNTTSC